MAGSGTGKCLGWLYPVLLLLWAAQTSTLLIVLHLRHWGASTAPPGWFLGFTGALPQFWSVTFSRQSLPAIHPMITSLILPGTSNLLFFCKLFGGKFCEQPLVLGKLLNTVKWSTFWVSFIRVLTILGWLWCIEIFKIDYLVTFNVRFGLVSINPVTNYL